MGSIEIGTDHHTRLGAAGERVTNGACENLREQCGRGPTLSDRSWGDDLFAVKQEELAQFCSRGAV